MVCLPLLDVKFNFAVAGGKIGLFKSEYFYFASEVLFGDRAIAHLFGGEFTRSRRL
ncbi:hypothetical protein QUB63_00660 [Microcoleus sp. ARI1-B5]|uniref:hypothetical protein n=1 Tax=unclassified Microcoleus TaxID=2642155 RepID=UPI002FD26781